MTKFTIFIFIKSLFLSSWSIDSIQIQAKFRVGLAFWEGEEEYIFIN